MTRRLVSLSCLAALAFFGAAFLVMAAGPSGRDSRTGKVTQIAPPKGGVTLATATLEGASAAPKDSTMYGGTPKEVRPGMQVRLTVLLETSVFSPTVGTVMEVSADGSSIVFSVDEGAMETVLQDPTSGQRVKVGDLFRVGASISVS